MIIILINWNILYLLTKKYILYLYVYALVLVLVLLWILRYYLAITYLLSIIYNILPPFGINMHPPHKKRK